MALLEVKNVKKVYTARLGSVKVQALQNVNFSVEEGEYVAIMGESGSGKTTLLNILASLDRATSGQVLLNGRNLAEIRQRELCAFRSVFEGQCFPSSCAGRNALWGNAEKAGTFGGKAGHYGFVG